jgi:hypothetical protein
MTEQILDCKGCGKEPQSDIINYDHYQMGRLYCKSCEPIKKENDQYFNTKKEAIREWNERNAK